MFDENARLRFDARRGLFLFKLDSLTHGVAFRDLIAQTPKKSRGTAAILKIRRHKIKRATKCSNIAFNNSKLYKKWACRFDAKTTIDHFLAWRPGLCRGRSGGLVAAPVAARRILRRARTWRRRHASRSRAEPERSGPHAGPQAACRLHTLPPPRAPRPAWTSRWPRSSRRRAGPQGASGQTAVTQGLCAALQLKLAELGHGGLGRGLRRGGSQRLHP